MKFVLVGTGLISETYVDIVQKQEESSIVAVVSRSGNCPKGLDVPVFASLSAVQVPFDATIIATPNGTHCSIIEEAARLGKHSLVEKPLDITPKACDCIIETERKHKVFVGVAFQRRFSQDNVQVKKLLDTGALGKVIGADLTAKFLRDQAYYDQAHYRGGYAIDGGGPFIQQAVHNIDILCWFFGMPSQVHSLLGTFAHDIEAEDHGAALLRYRSGMIATIVASTCCSPGFPARLEITTDKGSLVMVNDSITEWNIKGIENPSTGIAYNHAGAASAKVTDTAGHAALVEDFARNVASDRSPAVTSHSARMATDLIDMIYTSGAATHFPRRNYSGSAPSTPSSLSIGDGRGAVKRRKVCGGQPSPPEQLRAARCSLPAGWVLSAFADEAGESASEQLAALAKAGLNWIDLRNVGGCNVSSLPLAAARRLRQQLDAADVRVNMLGSPIGKCSLDCKLEEDLVRLRHLAAVGNVVGCGSVRIFSYYNSEAQPLQEEEWKAEVLRRLKVLKTEASKLGMTLYLENEGGLFGDTVKRVQALLGELRDEENGARVFGSIFDLDNYLQAGEDVWEAWQTLRELTDAFHLKESRCVPAGGFEHVPLGAGDVSSRRILQDAKQREFQGSLSLEPHLTRSPAVLKTGPHGLANASLSSLGALGTFQIAAEAAWEVFDSI